MRARRLRAKLPRMDPNVVIFFALEGYAIAAALIVIAVLSSWRGSNAED